jgi:Methyltransferase domain
MITVNNLVHVMKRSIGLEKDGREWLLEMMPKHAVCAEIGVYRGAFSYYILKVTKPKLLHLIDPWEAYTDPGLPPKYARENPEQKQMDEIYERVCERYNSPQVQIHRAGSEDITQQFPDNYFDWIYLDGDHRYEGVLGDLKAFHAKVKSGGIVAGDDYARPKSNWSQDGVTRALDEILTTDLYEPIKVDAASHQFILRRRAVARSAVANSVETASHTFCSTRAG